MKTDNGPNNQVDISGVVSLALEVVTLLINILPLLVIFAIKKRNDRTLTDFFLGVLTINDLLAEGLPLTIGLPSFLEKQWVGGRTSCRIYQITSTFFLVSSMLLVTVMSIDRYMALFRPIFHRRVIQQSKQTRKLIIVLLYSISLFVSCLPLSGLGKLAQDDHLTYCPLWLNNSSKKGRNVYILLLTSLGYTTCLIIFFANWAVLYKLRQFNQRFRTQPITVHSNMVDKYALVSFAKLICVIGLLFYLTWTPLLVSIISTLLCNTRLELMCRSSP